MAMSARNYLKKEEYQAVATAALEKLVLMPTTYLCEKGFSCLVELKTKKRKRLQCLDVVMRGALEVHMSPRFKKLCNEMQIHCSH